MRSAAAALAARAGAASTLWSRSTAPRVRTMPASAGSLILLLLARLGGILDRHLVARLQARQHLYPVEAAEAGLHRAHVEGLLPLLLLVELGRRIVLLSSREDAAQQARGLRGLGRARLLDVDELGVILAEEGLDGH